MNRIPDPGWLEIKVKISIVPLILKASRCPDI